MLNEDTGRESPISIRQQQLEWLNFSSETMEVKRKKDDIFNVEEKAVHSEFHIQRK